VRKSQKRKPDRRAAKTKAERRVIAELYRSLLDQEVCLFPPAKGNLKAPNNAHGVYIIRDSSEHIVHVGRTYRGKRGLWQRLNNHLQGKSSFVKVFLKGKKWLLRESYTYQLLKVAHPRKRALLENLAAGLLCPEHLGVGKSRLL
jgi:hypothetical protein